MSALEEFSRLFSQCPLIAILRGIRPDEVIAIGEALHGAGINLIEVPLNSPDPLESISRLSRHLGKHILVGAGTVLHPAEVERVRDAGGRLIVSPNTDPKVIGVTADLGLVSCPGFFTPSEAFLALGSGAHVLKFFPAEAGSPSVVKAQRAVLPPTAKLVVVGGITPDHVAAYRQAGADGFGLGSVLYRPGATADAVRLAAEQFRQAL